MTALLGPHETLTESRLGLGNDFSNGKLRRGSRFLLQLRRFLPGLPLPVGWHRPHRGRGGCTACLTQEVVGEQDTERDSGLWSHPFLHAGGRASPPASVFLSGGAAGFRCPFLSPHGTGTLLGAAFPLMLTVQHVRAPQPCPPAWVRPSPGPRITPRLQPAACRRLWHPRAGNPGAAALLTLGLAGHGRRGTMWTLGSTL